MPGQPGKKGSVKRPGVCAANSVKVRAADLTRSFSRSEKSAEGFSGAKSDAHIAQSVEHSLGKGEVIGSNPIVSTIFEAGFPNRKAGRRQAVESRDTSRSSTQSWHTELRK